MSRDLFNLSEEHLSGEAHCRVLSAFDGGHQPGFSGWSGRWVLLTETIRASGLGVELSAALGRWRKPTAVHDPAKIVLDLALTLAVGGDCLADIALLRAEPGIYGRVASDPTVSRTVDVLAADADAALTAIDTARAAARARVWTLAGDQPPDRGIDAAHPLIMDVDATLVGSHSEKELAKPTFKRGFGFHPLCVFVDHGALGTGDPLQIRLRPGNAGSNTAADHIAVVKSAGCKGQVDSDNRSVYDGEVSVDLVLKFSKDNKMPLSGGKMAWIQFYNGKVWVKSYCDQKYSYSQTWS